MLAIHLPNLPDAKVPHEDAGVFLYTASVILDGGLPYRDVWDHKAPLVYYLDALGLFLAGGSAVGVWALQAVALLAAALAGQVALSRAFGGAPALFGSLAWLLAAPRLQLAEGQFTSFVQTFALPLQLAALALFARAERAGWRRGAAAGLGVLAALATLLSPAALGVWAAIALHQLVSRRPVEALGRLRTAALAGAAVVGAVLLAFAAAGALVDLLDQAVAYNAIYASISPADARIRAAWEGLRLTASSGLAVVALAGWALAARALAPGPDAWRAHPLLFAGFVALPLEVASVAAAGRPFGHYYLAWLPSLAVLAAFAGRELAERARRLSRAAWAGPLALAALIALMAVRPIPLAVRVARSTDDGLARAAAEHIRATTSSEDLVLVWGSRTEVNVLSGRRAPSRFVYQYGPLYTRHYQRAERVEELLAELRRRPPSLIVDASRDSPVTPPLDRAGLLAFDTRDPVYRIPVELERVVAHIERMYEQIAPLTPSGWRVYRLRGR